MRLIAPVIVTDANLSASNIAEDDAPVWDDVTTYGVSDRVIRAHRVYESQIADNLNLPPEDHLTGDPVKWIDLGPTNRYRMFGVGPKDGSPAIASQRTGVIDATVDVAEPHNCVGLINVTGISVTIQVVDPQFGVVYERTQSLEDLSGIDDWHDYFFAPRERRLDIVFLDLPTTAGTSVRIVINAGGSLARCGQAIIGQQRRAGELQFESRHSIRDYSTQTVDGFGAGTFVKRGYAKGASFPVAVKTTRIASVLRLLASRRAQPTLFVGTEHAEETIVYGTYKRTEWGRNNAQLSMGTIECESLVYEEQDVLFEGAAINAPSLLAPVRNDAMPVNGILWATAFATTPEGRDTHVETDWQIADDADFASIADESLADTANLTSYPITPAALTVGNTYYARVRYRGQSLGESPWSTTVMFTASASASVNTTSITSPTESEEFDLDRLVTTAAFATTPAAADDHAATDWQVSENSGFSSIFAESLDDATNLTTWLLPYTLQTGNSYYVRARHRGRKTGYGAFSPARGFIAGAPAGQALFTSPGSYPFEVPTGVTLISAAMIGASGGPTVLSTSTVPAPNGGGGGGLRWRNAIAVTPGETLTVEVGAGGDINEPVGGHTRLLRGTTELLRAGGAQGRLGGTGTAIGGNVGGGNGGDGGTGGGSEPSNSVAGGGGGVGGYSGPGGAGATLFAQTPGSGTGGAAAGGGAAGPGNGKPGGGVGLYGQGTSGVGALGQPGEGGSGGTTGDGGAGGVNTISGVHTAGHGSARIIWGSGRSFPSTNVS
jgi:hypothetical protein